MTHLHREAPAPSRRNQPDFSSFGLSPRILRAVQDEGYKTPTPIQAGAIPALLKGSDLLGCAETGTGKTAAFALPTLQRLDLPGSRPPRRGARALVLTPTRELAIQIADSFRTYGRHLRLSFLTVFGGVSQRPQVATLARGIDVLVATPGRLLDLMNQGCADLRSVEILILDEADRMLDMGFLPDVRRILASLPAKKQTALFSATLPPQVKTFAKTLLTSPLEVSVAKSATTVAGVTQRVMYVERGNKRALLTELLRDKAMHRTLVFTRTKHGANRLARHLERTGSGVEAIHGNKSQNARQAALKRFRSGRTRILVATDVAARGLDIDDITHVINFELPNEPESYVHRIGRTARAGSQGVALSLCSVEERGYLRNIERLTRKPISVIAEHPYRSAVSLKVRKEPKRPSSLSGKMSSGRPDRSRFRRHRKRST